MNKLEIKIKELEKNIELILKRIELCSKGAENIRELLTIKNTTNKKAVLTSDLRIGNFLNWAYLKDCEKEEAYICIVVKGIKENEISLSTKCDFGEHDTIDCNIDRVEGIPLSPEWLKRFDFRYIQNACWKFGSMRIHNVSDESNSRFRITLAGLEIVIIKYVHQLQNIHYLFTGKELYIANDD